MATAKKQAPAPAKQPTPKSSKGPSTAVAKAKSTALVSSAISIEADAGQGFENTDKDSFAIPFIRILQSGSPQCKKSSPDYIKGAEEGDFYNTVTKEVIKGEDGFDFIMCHYDRKFTEWAPNRGGFRGEHNPFDPILSKVVTKIIQGDDGTDREVQVLPNGNSVQDTRYHFSLMIRPDGTSTPVLICMASSGIKKSKRIMTELNGIKLKNAEGKAFTPPLFFSLIHMGSVGEQKDDFTWSNYDPTIVRQLDISDDDDANLYMEAKAFRDSIAKGAVKYEHESESAEEGAGDQF